MPMKNLNCRNCGATMVLDASGMTAICHYCGPKYVLTHEDTDYYHAFFAQMTGFLASSKDDRERKRRAEALWENAREKVFVTEDGGEIEVKYMYCYSDRDADIYTARRNIIFHFKEDGARKADRFRRNVSMLDYPSADMRNLSEHFPKISGGFALEDGSFLLVVHKNEDEYPLRLFGKLHCRHAAWLISRMENLCCVLEYNALVHPQIDIDSLYINPYTHQAGLYGGWWNVVRNNTYLPEQRRFVTTHENLVGLRNTAAQVLGYESAVKIQRGKEIPAPMVQFIAGKPSSDAYEDFERWDEVILQAFGGRQFFTLSVDDEQIYGEKR